MHLTNISKTILNIQSSPEELEKTLDAFAEMCGDISGIEPSTCYQAWSGDTLLSNGVAIDPKAAAYCVKDYQRSVVFIRGVYAALMSLRVRGKSRTPTTVLYAGCGPFATLLLPLLPLFDEKELSITFLDIHEESLDSVRRIIKTAGFSDYKVNTVRDDACSYRHSELLDMIVVETMQKALEQEPQFAVTANLSNQIKPGGYFIPELIQVDLYLTNSEAQKAVTAPGRVLGDVGNGSSDHKVHVRRIVELSAASVECSFGHTDNVSEGSAKQLSLSNFEIPTLNEIDLYRPALFTRIKVFADYCLEYYQSSLTLPSRCYELEPLVSGDRYRAGYLLSSYPKIIFERV